MKRVFKYPLALVDVQNIQLPAEAEILTVQVQDELPCLWVLVDDAVKSAESRVFRIAGTGHSISSDIEIKYLDTFQLMNGGLVFHVFEVLR